MKTLLSPHFVPLVVTTNDLAIAAIAFGFTLGFGVLTTWHAIEQSVAIYRRHGLKRMNSTYVWMIWLEILACTIFAIICWLHLSGTIPPSFAFFFCILTMWSLQVQFLLQIIINRIALLLPNKQLVLRLKYGVAFIITSINISVYCIWVPARLQISERYVYLNDIWDRCEKVIFLIVDAGLNWLFITTVRKRLVEKGMTKYDRLVRFNKFIVGISLSMDCLIIGMMSLNNSFVYMQVHPLAYIVKLNIEMSMAELLAKISASPASVSRFPASGSRTLPRNSAIGTHHSKTFGVSQDVAWRNASSRNEGGGEYGNIMLTAKQEVSIQVERRKSLERNWKEDGSGSSISEFRKNIDDDTKPLKDEDRKREAIEMVAQDQIVGVERGMGVFTNIWGSQNAQQDGGEVASGRDIQA